MKIWAATRNAIPRKHHFWQAFLSLFFLIYVASASAQGCANITFAFDHYEPCKFRATYDDSTDCFIEIRYILESGTFSSWSVNSGAGFTAVQISPSEIWIHHNQGFLPPGNQTPLLFTLPPDLNTTMNIAYLDDCAQLGCELFGGLPIASCPDPRNAKIIGVKYRECASLPYINQTPISDWLIQLFDADGNLYEEQITEADGSYAFLDLPRGQYIVREAQLPGWTPSVPASGEITLDLDYSQQRIANFGNCPPPQPAPCVCPTGTQPGGNAVVNGNFSASGGFNTSYTLNNSPALQPGQYWIGSNPSQINAGFSACGDHTTGAGNMMVVNGAPNQTTTVWSQTFTLSPNSNYKFEAWVASLTGASPAHLFVNFIANNVMWSQDIFAPTTPCTWEYFCRTWPNSSANPVTLTISIVNDNAATTGNDFAIDDISFRRCVVPHGTLSGVIYPTCDSSAYAGQPGLAGVTVQLLDSLGNLIAEQVSDTSGAYAFTDLFGVYSVKVVQGADAVPSIPASGLAVVNVEAGGAVVQHFGICRLPSQPCNCPLNYAPGNNLVWNSDFSLAGGFTSGFSQNTSGPPLLLNQYWVGSAPHSIDADFQPCNDHTPGVGNMLISKGDLGGINPPLYWQQGPITVTPNTNYIFSVWVTPLNGASPDYIVLLVNGSVVAVQKITAPPCTWKRICGSWNSGTNNMATLEIRGFAVNAGDAIALDDVGFTPCQSSILNPIFGKLYHTCTAQPYTDQPVYPNLTVQMLDTMGVLVDEQVTGADGAFAFDGLPPAPYWVKVVVPNGWEPSLPASGQVAVTIVPGVSIEQNFGLCETDCTCTGFSGLQFTAIIAGNPFAPVPVDCDNISPVTLQCNPLEYYSWGFEGNFGCTSECDGSVHFEMFNGNNNSIGTGQASYNNGTFSLQGIQYPPGAYTLKLKGYCGTTDSCECTVKFIVPACGCCSENYDAFNQSAETAITLSFDPNSCKATLDLSNPAVCQQVNNINWGDQTIDPNAYNPGQMVMHVYTQAGTFTVSYVVYEFNGVTGMPCFSKTVTKTLTVTCPPCNCQESNLAFVQSGVSHPVLCGNGSQTPTFGCPAADVSLAGSFGCVQPTGDHCDPSVITWNLYGPNGFVSQGNFTGPVLGLIFPAADISTPGTYTVSMQMLCPGKLDSCYCQLQWIQGACDPCCQQDYASFLVKAMDVKTFGTLGNCTVGFQATGLDDCMVIRYNWGDNSAAGPFGENIPVTHTYTQPGTYNVCITIEEINAGGTACHTYISCEQITVACNNCVCGTFSNLVARPTTIGQGIALTCGGTYGFNCPDPGRPLPITGKFMCQGNACSGNVSTISWTLATPVNNINYSGTIQAGPYFYLPILPYQYSTPGVYTLTLSGSCDGQACPPCVIRFSVNCPEPCPCNTGQLLTDVSKGFASILNNTNCKACFSPIGLNDCDMVQWSVNGGTAVGMTNGNGTFCHTFPSSGTYSVKMTVTRKRSDGAICAQAVYSKNVTITCLFTPDCNGPIFANPRMAATSAGGLNSGGVCPGWIGLNGDPKVVEGTPGSHDGWTIEIGGNLDTSDVLSQATAVCLQKDTGVVSFRFKRPDNATNISFGCNLSVQLFRGEAFVLEYPTWNPIRCFKLASIELAPIDVEWVDVEVPYNLNSWGVLDTCGEAPYGVYVRPVVYITNGLSSDQGGADTRTRVQLDNFCVDGQLVGVTAAAKARMRIAPNPNPGLFTVTLPEPAPNGMVFRIADPAGRRVQEQATDPGNTQQTVHVETLPNGLYFLQMVKDGKVLVVEKFVKQ